MQILCYCANRLAELAGDSIIIRGARVDARALVSVVLKCDACGRLRPWYFSEKNAKRACKNKSDTIKGFLD